MKKQMLLLLTLVPIVAGYIRNATILIPGLGTFLYYVIPIAIVVFWFWLGQQFARTDWKAIPAILLGNAAGMVSLMIYLWQFVLESDEPGNLALASFSSMFSSAVSSVWMARIAILLETEPNTIGMASTTGLTVISTLYLVLIFAVAVFLGKGRMKKEKTDI